MEAIQEFLSKYDTTALPKVPSITVFPSTIDLPTAFKTLTTDRIASAPVFDEETRDFVGFLDTRDLLSWCVFASDEKNVKPSLKDVINVGTKASAVALRGITASYLAKRHPFSSVKVTDTLDQVATKLARHDVHRVPVVGEDEQLVSLISQSVIVKFLHDNVKQLGPSMQMTLKHIGLGSSPVLTVPSTATAAEVFKLMDNKGRNGLGIVEDGVLIANTSASDIKLFLDNPCSLNTNIITFIRAIHGHDKNTHAPVITVHETDTFEHLIGRMAATRVHRVFLTDLEHRPLKVISISDVMKCVSEPEAWPKPDYLP